VGPIDLNIVKEKVRDLDPLLGPPWFYIRISFPFKDEFLEGHPMTPSKEMSKYDIPWIHLRNNYNPRSKKKADVKSDTPPKTPEKKAEARVRTPSPPPREATPEPQKLIDPEPPKIPEAPAKIEDDWSPTKPLGVKLT
jgi:hypothetical protein